MPRHYHSFALAALTAIFCIGAPDIHAQQSLSATDWAALSNSQTARAAAAGFTYGGKLFACAGRDATLQATHICEAYDTSTDEWTVLAPVPRAVANAGVQVVDGSAWLVGGLEGEYPGTPIDNVQIYDIARDSWRTGARLPAARASGSLALLGRKLHYIGGVLSDGVTDVNEHYVLDVDHPADGWTSAAPLPSSGSHAGVAVLHGRIYVIGGRRGQNDIVVRSRLVHVYDGTTDSWSSAARLPEGRSHIGGSTLVHNGRIIVSGGRGHGAADRSSADEIFAYDPGDDEWSDIGRLAVKMHSFEAGIIRDQLVLAHGSRGLETDVQLGTFSIALEASEPDAMGFWPPMHDLHITEGSSLRAEALLWTGRDEASFDIDTQALPSWLTLSSESSGTVVPTGSSVDLRADASTLDVGTYRATLTAAAAPYALASIEIFLTVTPRPTDVFIEESGLIVAEAENFQMKHAGVVHDWNVSSVYESSGAAVVASPDEGANWEADLAPNGPELQYRVRFATSGTYYVWVRGWGPNGNADSWHVGLDGTPSASADRMTLMTRQAWPPEWAWSTWSMDGPRATLEIPAPGERIVSVWMREDGTFLDRLILTTDQGFVPEGVGPDESQRMTSVETSRAGDPDKPAVFTLEQNYPNPFNPSTVIRYAVPAFGHARLAVYDLLGREVVLLVNQVVAAGSHEVRFDGTGLPSGVYFSELRAGGSTQFRPMLLVR